MPRRFVANTWRKLSREEKDSIVGPLLDQGMTLTAIAKELGIPSKGSISTIRARIKKYREENRISMVSWNRRTDYMHRADGGPKINGQTIHPKQCNTARRPTYQAPAEPSPFRIRQYIADEKERKDLEAEEAIRKAFYNF